MIQPKSQALTTLLLIGGCSVMLLIPNWIAYLMLSSVAIALILQSVMSHTQSLRTIKIFVVEFLGFSLLVGCFVGTMVAVYGLLFS